MRTKRVAKEFPGKRLEAFNDAQDPIAIDAFTAVNDALRLLPNRNAVVSRLQQAIEKRSPAEATPFAMAVAWELYFQDFIAPRDPSGTDGIALFVKALSAAVAASAKTPSNRNSPLSG